MVLPADLLLLGHARLAELIALPLFSLIGYHGPKLVQYFSGW